jgi:hypothetical protein
MNLSKNWTINTITPFKHWNHVASGDDLWAASDTAGSSTATRAEITNPGARRGLRRLWVRGRQRGLRKNQMKLISIQRHTENNSISPWAKLSVLHLCHQYYDKSVILSFFELFPVELRSKKKFNPSSVCVVRDALYVMMSWFDVDLAVQTMMVTVQSHTTWLVLTVPSMRQQVTNSFQA